MSGGSILIVDDVEANLLALEVALAPFDRRIVKARSGQEALAALLEHDFVLVLLDVAMPSMDGFETARWIRTRRDVPIIFVTAHDRDAAGINDAYKLGLVDFLFKPLDPDVVRAKSRVFIALHERTQELARLAHANAELALADRRKTESLSTLAHELRNPLAPIRTAIDVLREAPDRIPPARAIEVLDRQFASLTRLVDDMLDISRRESPPSPQQPELPTSSRRILVVDDNEDTRSLMAAILSLRGHRVTTADDGPSGLVALCGRVHDIALVDIGLPGFDGLELVRRAREDCPDLTTKLVAMTGYGHEDDRKRTTKAGFEAHLLKPVTSTEVFDIVDRLCAERSGS